MTNPGIHEATTITASREIRINLGNFEHAIVIRTITGIPGHTEASEIDDKLDELMAGDLAKARAATSYADADNETSVYEWINQVGGK